MNLVLVGYRGTGKSTIGERLAARLALEYVELDGEIVRRAGKSIPQIVADSSWSRFRDLEEEVVAAAAAADGRVIDTGGGVVTRAANVRRLRENGVIFLLEASVADIVARIGDDSHRPSLTGAKSFTEEVEEVLAARRPLYSAAADHIIDTSALSIDEAVARIAARYRERAGGPAAAGPPSRSAP